MKKIIKENGRTRVITSFTQETKTQQQFKKDCDINYIIKKYKAGHEITHINNNSGSYGDFTGIVDYQGSLDKILQLNSDFMNLPAETRSRFHNDPTRLIEFVKDPNNFAEGVKLGIFEQQLDNVQVNNHIQTEPITAPKTQEANNDK